MNGLNITDKSLDKLPIKQQLVIVRQNTEMIKSLLGEHMEKFENHEKTDKWNFWSLRLIILVLAMLAGLGRYIGVI